MDAYGDENVYIHSCYMVVMYLPFQCISDYSVFFGHSDFGWWMSKTYPYYIYIRTIHNKKNTIHVCLHVRECMCMDARVFV